MKTEIIKQITVELEKDDKESIKKVITLIGDLINTGYKNDCDCYEIDTFWRERGELEDLREFLSELACSDVIELT